MKLKLLLLLLSSSCLNHNAYGFVSTPPPSIISSRRETTTSPLALVDATPAFPSSGTLTGLAIAGVLGTLTDPLVEAFFNATQPKDFAYRETNFRSTFLYGAADSIAVAARTYGSLILISILSNMLHIQLPIGRPLSEAAPTIATAIWAALTICTVKRTRLLQFVSGNRLGRVSVFDKLIDCVVIAVTLAVVLDILSIDVGMGLQSIFAASGAGALLFSLASRDLAENIVGGITVQAWSAFEVGDDVRLGDGTEGTVQRIGLVETEIVQYDNTVLRIPNSQLTKARLVNISRVKKSRVLQTLRFKYSDLDKLPKALDDIKEEIMMSCPKLITDGSKPFLVKLTQYEQDHVQAVVNCHFNLPPGSLGFAENRQEMLLAISRAMKNNEMQFAIPTIYYKTSDNIEVDVDISKEE